MRWLFVIAIACVACAPSGSPTSSDSRNVGDVTMTLHVEPARVQGGQTVRLRLSLQNNSGRPVSLRYSSGRRYEIAVVRGDKAVWTSSQDKAYTQSLVNEELPGSSGSQFNESWEAGVSGRYVVTAELLAEGFGGRLETGLVVE